MGEKGVKGGLNENNSNVWLWTIKDLLRNDYVTYLIGVIATQSECRI